MTLAPAPALPSPAASGPVGFAAAPGEDAGRWMVGRAPAEGAAILPRVFNLCAAAHRAACTRALGLSPATDDAAKEDAAMRAETVRDQGLALFHGWPTLLGLAPDRDGLKLLGQGDAGALSARIGGDDLSAFSLSDLDLWLHSGATSPARTLRQIRDHTDPAWGRAALPPLTVADLDAALNTPGSLASRETTALARVGTAPLIAALMTSEGPSLFTRLMARVVDLLWAAYGRYALPLSGRTAQGAGFAQAARGLLVHKAQVEGNRIHFYRVLSPSAWNLAPEGLLARMLAALPFRRETPMLAQLAACAVNPCVPVTFTFGAGA